MRRPYYDDNPVYDEDEPASRLAPLAPTVIWGLVTVAALTGAAVTVWRANSGPSDRLVASASDAALRQDFARLSAERDMLAGRVTSLERGLGEMKLARRDDPETTGALRRPAGQPAARIGLSLGIEPSSDAAKRRWMALAARFPQQLSGLAPLARREPGKAPLFDLVAGPFDSRDAASRTCGALAEQGLACDTTDYAGEPIGR